MSSDRDLVTGQISAALTDVEQPLPEVETSRPVADRETTRETSAAELRALGIDDVKGITPHDYWTWCRRHRQAAKVGLKCHDSEWPTRWFPLDACVRVGPFMSEREANRLTGNQPAGYGAWALGMEVE